MKRQVNNSLQSYHASFWKRMETYIKVVYRHLVFVYTISPSVTLPAVLQTVIPSLIISWGQRRQYKIDISWLSKCIHWKQCFSSHVPIMTLLLSHAQWPQKQSQSISFSSPPDPPSNPHPENPGYGPACPVLSTKAKTECDSESLVKLSLHT